MPAEAVSEPAESSTAVALTTLQFKRERPQPIGSTESHA